MRGTIPEAMDWHAATEPTDGPSANDPSAYDYRRDRAWTSWDADRLEELALSCEALNSDLMLLTPAGRAALAVEAQRAHRHLTVLKRSVHFTRENLKVLKNLSAAHREQLEYSPGPLCDWETGEREHGNN